MCRGDVILLGDFNSRHRSWDRITIAQGSVLLVFAERSRICVRASLFPTYATGAGECAVDILLTRNYGATGPTIAPTTRVFDHPPIISEVSLYPTQSFDTIPLSLANCARVKDRVLSAYERLLPGIATELGSSSSAEELGEASKHLAESTLRPWAAFWKPRPGRFRAGWTPNLHRLAKERTALWKQGDP